MTTREETLPLFLACLILTSREHGQRVPPCLGPRNKLTSWATLPSPSRSTVMTSRKSESRIRCRIPSRVRR
jgi:hypothetical protein